MKKKYLVLAAGLTAFLLASCGGQKGTTTSTETPSESTTAVVTTSDIPSETTTDITPVHVHVMEEVAAKSANYKRDGNTAYQYCAECDTYFDMDGNVISESDTVIPMLTLSGKVTEVKGNVCVTSIDQKAFVDAYSIGDLLTITNGAVSYTMPFSYFKEAVQENDSALVWADTVNVETNGDAGALFEKGDEVTVSFKSSKSYDYTVELFNYMESKTSTKLKQAATISGKEFTIEYKSADYDTYHDYFQQILDAVEKAEEEYSVLDEMYQTFCDNYEFLYNQYLKVEIMADSTAEEKYYDMADELYSLLGDMETQDQKIDIAMASSKYRNDYYEGMTEEEIDEYVAGLDPDAYQAKTDASTAMEEALNSYYSGDSTAIEALKSYVTSATTLATLSGYTDYLSYSYENVYGREYTVAETEALDTFMKNYISKTYKLVSDEWSSFYGQFKTGSEPAYKEFFNYYDNFYAYYFDYINEYSLLVGEDFRDDFITYFTSGNYWYSDIDNDNVTGYCNIFYDGTPYMFLGSEYQNMSTFVHEFGHYNASLTGGDVDSYDLAETQSQGDEALFYLFFDSKIGSEAARGYLTYNAYNLLEMVETGYMINDLEKYIYTTDPSELTMASIEAKWYEIAKAMGRSDMATEDYMDYVMEILLNYQGYYISYSVSAIGALEIFAAGMTDYDAALESYRYIYAAHEDMTYTEILEGAGLYGIFDENTYKNIRTAFAAFFAD